MCAEVLTGKELSQSRPLTHSLHGKNTAALTSTPLLSVSSVCLPSFLSAPTLHPPQWGPCMSQARTLSICLPCAHPILCSSLTALPPDPPLPTWGAGKRESRGQDPCPVLHLHPVVPRVTNSRHSTNLK